MWHTAFGPLLATSLLSGLGVELSARASAPAEPVMLQAADDAASARARARPRVRDITLRVDPRRRGFGAYSDTWGDSLVFHKNRDGHPDVLLSFHHTRRWQIWLGTRGGRFTFDRSLPVNDRHHCVSTDVAGPDRRRPDGRTDLYCVRGANNGTLSTKTNELLIQQPSGGFRNVAPSWGVADRSGRGRTASVLDIRGDGRPSLFVGNAKPADHPSRDHIFVNRGRRYVERRTGGLPSPQNTTCSATGDFDSDGRQDFLSCSSSLRLYRNRTARDGPVSYREVSDREGIPDQRWRDAGLVRLNRDRWPDLVTVSPGGLDVRLNAGTTPHFAQVDFTLPLTAGYTFCSGRANGDRANDLLVVQKLASPTDRIQRRDWMLINAGRGVEFRTLPVPQPPRRHRRNGNGDTCAAIPRYRGDRAAWTISNGMSTATPEEVFHRGYRQLVVLGR